MEWNGTDVNIHTSCFAPDPTFPPMRHCVFVILASSGAMDNGKPRHRAVYFGPREAMGEKIC